MLYQSSTPLFIHTIVNENPTPAIKHNGNGYNKIMDFKFNVTLIPGLELQQSEVRVYHNIGVGASCAKFSVLLFEVNDKNEATEIDKVTIETNYKGWVIFDSADWQKRKQNGIHRLAVAVSNNDCPSDSLQSLGFPINNGDSNTLPMLVLFTSQERLMTEVKIISPTLAQDLLEDQQKKKRQTTTNPKRCHLQDHEVIMQ